MTDSSIPRQLSLPLQNVTTPQLSPPDHQAVIAALAQLLLTAAIYPGGQRDE